MIFNNFARISRRLFCDFSRTARNLLSRFNILFIGLEPRRCFIDWPWPRSRIPPMMMFTRVMFAFTLTTTRMRPRSMPFPVRLITTSRTVLSSRISIPVPTSASTPTSFRLFLLFSMFAFLFSIRPRLFFFPLFMIDLKF